ncbi:MAG: FAD-binding oxidoreductase [Oligoflexales bacterium]
MSDLSWGRLWRKKVAMLSPMWRDTLVQDLEACEGYLPHGLGRSYGDVGFNSHGTTIDMTRLKRLLRFDFKKGVIVAEAGMSLAELIPIATSYGWFPPVVPGTAMVTLGGAIANDIHGKNHHVQGSFGHHVMRFELMRSNSKGFDFVTCSPDENSDLFYATIGGLGMTGVITTIQLQLIPGGSFVKSEKSWFQNQDEFHAIQSKMDRKYDQTVSWVNVHACCEGVVIAGSLAGHGRVEFPKPRGTIPDVFPTWCMNRLTMKTMNNVYGYLQKKSTGKKRLSIPQFFFPLDRINHWNRVYGKKGFYQYQFVVPLESKEILWNMIEQISTFSPGASLGVLKAFGDKRSLGIMSFPRQGWTLAVDFPYCGQNLFRFLNQLDQKVLDAGGRVYLAKDARIQPKTAESMYPQFQKWQSLWDEKCSSDFVRRMKWD